MAEIQVKSEKRIGTNNGIISYGNVGYSLGDGDYRRLIVKHVVRLGGISPSCSTVLYIETPIWYKTPVYPRTRNIHNKKPLLLCPQRE